MAQHPKGKEDQPGDDFNPYGSDFGHEMLRTQSEMFPTRMSMKG
jgi:hypothetical protein